MTPLTSVYFSPSSKVILSVLEYSVTISPFTMISVFMPYFSGSVSSTACGLKTGVGVGVGASVGVGSGVAAASSCGVGVVCVMASVGVPDGSSSLPHALTAKSARTQSRKAMRYRVDFFDFISNPPNLCGFSIYLTNMLLYRPYLRQYSSDFFSAKF